MSYQICPNFINTSFNNISLNKYYPYHLQSEPFTTTNTSWFVYNIWFFYKIFCCIFVYIRLFCTSQNKSKTLMEYVNALPFNLCMSKNGKSAIRTH
ncbi:hypothetical protein GLOIN_2v809218 [Rhizophagus irregularis DAOM 181602=DAOM 197198]|nr:hypothetical protein GLOIN_2v809218 [Rhizophagus irregularis DAOM 181602=DAOM 197198]